MKKKKTINEQFDALSTQIASAMRTTLAKYKSLTDSLLDVSRGIESSKASCQSLYKAIDGPCWEVLSVNPRYRTDEFVQKLYDALTNMSIRKWTRAHVRLIAETKEQLESAARKSAKLKERFNADPDSTEAKATAVLLKRMSDTCDALEHRIAFAVRKFLELRLCILKSISGTTDLIFNAVGDLLTQEMLKDYTTVTQRECERIASTDSRAVRNGKRK